MDEALSPCIDVCALDDDGNCLGCLRSMDEITAWPYLDNDARHSLLAELVRRRAGLDSNDSVASAANTAAGEKP